MSLQSSNSSTSLSDIFPDLPDEVMTEKVCQNTRGQSIYYAERMRIRAMEQIKGIHHPRDGSDQQPSGDDKCCDFLDTNEEAYRLGHFHWEDCLIWEIANFSHNTSSCSKPAVQVEEHAPLEHAHSEPLGSNQASSSTETESSSISWTQALRSHLSAVEIDKNYVPGPPSMSSSLNIADSMAGLSESTAAYDAQFREYEKLNRDFIRRSQSQASHAQEMNSQAAVPMVQVPEKNPSNDPLSSDTLSSSAHEAQISEFTRLNEAQSTVLKRSSFSPANVKSWARDGSRTVHSRDSACTTVPQRL